MHDIDAQIKKISGQDNYMESLQKITGDIMTIDSAFYHDKHNKMSACDFNIKLLLKRITDEQNNNTINAIKASYDVESANINIKEGTFIIETKKTKKGIKQREVIAPGHKPCELINTQWFKQVKHIEKEIHKYLTKTFPNNEEPNFDKIQEEYTKHPELVDLMTLYDCKINTPTIFKSFIQLQYNCNYIINVLLTPMYDIKATIMKHWSKIEHVFKSKVFQQGGVNVDIVEMLSQFIIAKYRAQVTGNNKHYVKLFLSTIGNENISNLNGARFMEIMDSIDLDKLNKDENVYKFACGAKTTISKIINNDMNIEDLLHEFDTMFTKEETNDDDNVENKDILED